MTYYKVTNTAKLPIYLGKKRFDPSESKELELSDEEVESARRHFVFEQVEASEEEADEEPEQVQEDSKSEETEDSEDGGD